MWGFTRNEQRALLFLISTFVVGLGVQYYQRKIQPFPSSSSLSLFQEDTVAMVAFQKDESTPRSFKVELNRATMKELEEMPGIGPALAHRILEWRKEHGPFHQVEDLLQVKGIGAKTLEKIRPFLYIQQVE